MLCPCCGRKIAIDEACECGAVAVGRPVIEPYCIVPVLGLPVASVFLGLAGLAFLWIKGFIALSLIGMALSWIALRRIKRDPIRFGGRRIAIAGLLISVTINLTAAGMLAVYIPKAINARAERQRAATRAQMYHLAHLLTEYKKQYFTLPQDLSDLRRITAEPLPLVDYWENEFRYFPNSPLIARKNKAGAVPLLNFQIISAGPDGKFETEDDLNMINDIFVDVTKENAPHQIPPLF